MRQSHTHSLAKAAGRLINDWPQLERPRKLIGQSSVVTKSAKQRHTDSFTLWFRHTHTHTRTLARTNMHDVTGGIPILLCSSSHIVRQICSEPNQQLWNPKLCLQLNNLQHLLQESKHGSFAALSPAHQGAASPAHFVLLASHCRSAALMAELKPVAGAEGGELTG